MRMRSVNCWIVGLGSVGLLGTSALGFGGWVEFGNESSSRIVSEPSVGLNDDEEKDYAWGDFDNDGDTDLVAVRKAPFTNATGKRNVLFMNEGLAEGHSLDGVLVDRTEEYATAGDFGQGFLDITNDRDVAVADVDGDGWLDIITAPAYHAGDPHWMSHPRIYMNQGEDNGEWQGFYFDDSRIPDLGSHMNACGVAAGDVTGDGMPELYFVDYDSVSSNSYEDILLINDGNGFFTNETNTRLFNSATDSSFGTATEIADMNGDGLGDIVKSENGPVEVIYNGGDGFFDDMETVDGSANYHVSVADLNNDGMIDLVNSNDGTDRYWLNEGNGANGLADFDMTQFSGDDGFGSNSVSADLDNDGFLDVLIADVDVDIPGCSRRLHIYHNQGNPPNVSIIEQGTGGIPSNMLNGTHDVAPIDLDGDGYLDLVIGRCSGTDIWMQQPPIFLTFAYPDGRPEVITPGEPTAITVEVGAVGGSLDPSTLELVYSVDDGPFESVPATDLGGGLFEFTLPAVDCLQTVDYYITGETAGGIGTSDPQGAPKSTFSALAADGTEVTFSDAIEGDVSAWSIESVDLDSGEWEQANPNGTINDAQLAAPNEDYNSDGSMAFVTGNGQTGEEAAVNDVDGGPTRLLSPTIDLEGTDGLIHYARWVYNDDGDDNLQVHISNDGGTSWTFVHQTGGTNGWQEATFRVSHHITPTSNIRVRFQIADNPNNSITEAGIDAFRVEEFVCDGGKVCLGDVNGSGTVDVNDLLELLSAWGECDGECPADFDDSGSVDVSDLLALLGNWGAC